MRRVPWRYVLPLGNVAFAAGLMRIALEQATQYVTRTNALVVWDYIPSAAQITYMVNFPAFAASSGLRLLAGRWSFVGTVGFVICVAVLWYFVGLWADYRNSSTKRHWGRRISIVVSVCGLAASVGVGLFALAHLMLHPFLGVAGLIWFGFLLRTFLIALRRVARGELAHVRS